MINWRTSAVNLLILCLLSLFWQNAAYGQNAIAQSGNTVLTASNKNLKVIVTVSTAKVKPPLHITQMLNVKTVTMVEKLSISVNGKAIFVPYSVIADLIDPRVAAIKFEKNSVILSINGGDASESYTLRVYFDSKQVHRRSYFDSYFPNEPMEDTRYWLRVLKDE